jgi:aryl-alcohol dehydrogenase-like predicted oxidoreductase
MRQKHNKTDRRNFLKTMGAAGLGSVLGACKSRKESEQNAAEPNAPATAKKTERPQVPKRKLGKTGVEVPCLALGALFNLVENQLILEKCFQAGVHLWDTAPDYAGENSERGIGKFISRHPDARKKLFLVTKASDAVTVEDVEKVLQQSLKRMNTKYIDLYYIMDRMAGTRYVGHGLSDPAKLTDDLRQWVDSAKKRKLIRFFGFSTHKNMPECLAAAAKLGWIDAAMTTYSYRIMQDTELQDAVEACHLAGVGLIAMKTQGRPQEKIETEEDKKLAGHFLKKGFTEGQAKIKAVLQDKRISSACVGMQDVAILDQNVAAVLDKTNLSRQDMEIFNRHAHATCSRYCAGCAHICDSALPHTPYVSDIMRFLMYYNSYGDKNRARQLFAQIPHRIRNRLPNTDFSPAEARCPQHLPIGKLVAQAVSRLA